MTMTTRTGGGRRGRGYWRGGYLGEDSWRGSAGALLVAGLAGWLAVWLAVKLQIEMRGLCEPSVPLKEAGGLCWCKGKANQGKARKSDAGGRRKEPQALASSWRCTPQAGRSSSNTTPQHRPAPSRPSPTTTQQPNRISTGRNSERKRKSYVRSLSL